MGDVIDFNLARTSKDLDSEYFKYVSVVHNHLGIPKSPPLLYKTIYFTCRFLDRSIDSANILKMFGLLPQKQLEELKETLINFLTELIEEVKKL